jgi:peptidoglycan hydrolase-like protein with peptidoglycan-binding domain
VRVRRAAILVAALAFAPAAHAAAPTVSVQATPATGAAPLQVTLTATGDAVLYHWDLGDGTVADGTSVQHVYPAGRFTARVTGTSATGETAQAAVTITSLGVTLAAPHVSRYGRLVRFRGRLVPGLSGVRVTLYRGSLRVASARTGRSGRFAVRGRVGTAETQYTARYGGAVSNAVALAVRPALTGGFRGSGQVGRPLSLLVRERPLAAGPLTVRIWRNGRLTRRRIGHGRIRLRLATASPAAYRVVVSTTAVAGYVPARRRLERIVFPAALRPGSRGRGVYLLEHRLAELHYTLATVDGYYGADTADAVIAFQKLYGLPRTGSVDPGFWRALQRGGVPRSRHDGTHVEVSKERQVLFLVRDSRVILVVPVSTGATGNTPVGLWHVYSKVPGYNAKEMYYSSFFAGAFAIHGYHSVPPFPASHGCVRIPLWVAQRVYSLIDYGTPVYIY